jgi:uncharacterized protein (TIGR03435 family)
LITFAWNLNSRDEEVLVGAPKWLDSDHFDILAKVVSDAPSNLGQKAPRIDIEDLRQMMQALLKERFKLEKQRRPAPVLVIDHIEEKPTEN